jgi:acetyltransferase-like isoleucine patch superfamily enzyme
MGVELRPTLRIVRSAPIEVDEDNDVQSAPSPSLDADGDSRQGQLHHMDQTTLPRSSVPVADSQDVNVFARVWARRRLIGKILPALNARWYLRKATRRGMRISLVGHPRVVNDGQMTFGERVRLDSSVAKMELVSLPGGHLEIGNNVFINYGSSLVSSTHVKIGDDCLIGTHVMVMDCDFHRVEDKVWDTSGLPIVLEDRVWLGNRSIVLKGVTVGHDAVVAAGSVVTRNVPPRTVVAGVPAKVIRRF